MQSITLQTSDTVVTAGDVLGRLNYAASAEADGSAAILIAGSIYVQAEGSFQSSSNPAAIVFATAAADASSAVDRLKITDGGNLVPVTDTTYSLGSPSLNFKELHSSSGTLEYLSLETSNTMTPQFTFTGSGVNDTPINMEVRSSFQSATGSGTALLFQGTQGQLFSITDNLSSGTIFNVSDITGLPMLEVTASGDVEIGEFADNITIHQPVLISGGVPTSTTNKLYNNAGTLYFNGSALGGGLANIVEDTTPQLGGTLDANGNTIDMGTNTITDTKVGQWDTAYGWGDHASAGYLTADDDTYVSGVASYASGQAIENETQISSVSGWAATTHPTISAASSSDNSGRTYIQDITLDSNGHVTGLTTATETVTDTNTTYTAGNGLSLSSTTFSLDDPINLSELDESTDAIDDKILLWDESASTWKYMTLDNLQDAIDTTGAGGISNVVEDTTPQLGGTLDANGNSIDMGTNTITDTKVGQWDTAYGWGDHSTQGYLTADDDTYVSGVAVYASGQAIENEADIAYVSGVAVAAGGGTVQGTDGTYDIQPANEGATTGNARGESSVDLQTQRSAATQVASGGCSTISGGENNTASANYSTVVGGKNNTASGWGSTVGGCGNTASGARSTISGGYGNTASGLRSAIGGGSYHTASANNSTISGGSSNTASASYTSVGGGIVNCATSTNSTISGGYYNTAAGTNSVVTGGKQNYTNARHSVVSGHRNVIVSPTNECCSRGATISGGIGHNSSGGTINATTGDITGTITCCNAGCFSTISGGCRNIATGANSTVSGGKSNTASGGCAAIGGGVGNTASGSTSTVSGGFFSTASANFSTVGGGAGNTASGLCSTVSGGYNNTASSSGSTVSGGSSNTASCIRSTVGGGDRNTASGYASTVGGGTLNTASANFSTVGGGVGNTASGTCSTVGGGVSNTAAGTNSTVTGGNKNYTNARHSIVGGHSNVIVSPTNECCSRGATISGGIGHNSSGGTIDVTTGDITGTITCCNAGAFSTIGGGCRNIATGLLSTVSGGKCNTASNIHSTVSGGYCNTASAGSSTVSGGKCNTASSYSDFVGGGGSNTASGGHSTIGGGLINAASSSYSTIGGGVGNTASGSNSTVSGGYRNTASGNGSVVAGGGSNTARAGNTASGEASSVLGGHNNTASAYSSSVGGGNYNTASGSNSTVSGGIGSTASADSSTVIGGRFAKSVLYGGVAHAAGRFSSNGDAQHLTLVARDSTTDATANQVLFLNGSSERLVIPAETTWMFTIKLAAHNDTNNDGGWWYFRGGIARDGAGNTALIGSVTSEYSVDSNISTATAEVVADDTNDALEIRVTGVASKSIRWVAVADISQVSWGTP